MWPWPLTYDLEILRMSGDCEDTCSCKISSSWVQRFMSYRVQNLFALSRNGEKNPKIRSCDLDLWPIIFKINRVRAVVKKHVPAKFHRRAWGGSWVIVSTDKETPSETIRSSVRYRADSRKFCTFLNVIEVWSLIIAWTAPGHLWGKLHYNRFISFTSFRWLADKHAHRLTGRLRWLITGTLLSAKRFGYCMPDLPTFEELCDTADDRLFNKTVSNVSHVLHTALPPPSTASQHYDLRRRSHTLSFPEHATYLSDCNFITRMLYKFLSPVFTFLLTFTS